MKRIDYDDPNDDHDVTLFKFYSSFARILYDFIKKNKKDEACELIMAAIEYSTSFENEEDYSNIFSDLSLEYIWKTLRPNIGKSARDLARWRRAKAAKSGHANNENGHANNEQRLKEDKEEEQRIKEEEQRVKDKAEAPAPNPFEDEDLLEKANHASDVTLFENGQPTAETFDTSPPKSKGEILDYMQSKGHALEHLNVERFWNYYSQRGWRSKTGVPVIWRQKVDEWVVDDQREKIAELEERRRAGGS